MTSLQDIRAVVSDPKFTYRQRILALALNAMVESADPQD